MKSKKLFLKLLQKGNKFKKQKDQDISQKKMRQILLRNSNLAQDDLEGRK